MIPKEIKYNLHYDGVWGDFKPPVLFSTDLSIAVLLCFYVGVFICDVCFVVICHCSLLIHLGYKE